MASAPPPGPSDEPTSRRPHATDDAAARADKAALLGPAAMLAQACLDRGYGVEQELAAVDAVTARLRAGSAASEGAKQPRPRDGVQSGLAAGLEALGEGSEAQTG